MRLTKFIITTYKRSCGKVMFLHLSVILFTGRGLCPGGLCPGGSLSRGSLLQRPPRYGGRVGGTHPTGMHSYLFIYFLLTGTTNQIAHSMQGTDDPVTAAIHVILGQY